MERLLWCNEQLSMVSFPGRTKEIPYTHHKVQQVLDGSWTRLLWS